VLGSVSLISTVYNEIDSIRDFLESIMSQTVLPAEFIIVDAGSTDGTLDVLMDYARKYEWIKVYVVPGADIGQGRNEAIRRASGDVIAVTRNDFELFQGAVVVVPKERIFERPSRWSSRSLAFRREVWERVGEYPAFRTGEDTLFNLKIVESGFRVVFEPKAVVRWRMRPSWRAFFHQFYRYGYGDAKAGNLWKMKKNLLMVVGFWAYVVMLLVSAFISPLLMLLLLVPGTYLVQRGGCCENRYYFSKF